MIHQKQQSQPLKKQKMTKVITFLTVALFTIGVNAQDIKTAKKDKAKKEACCKKISKKDKKACCAKK
ncbi:hypothetical protein [Flavobacterium foetidum]|uniref:hypothetical protein n=1 Tax=Flavobacterium foetidum TaxID=2026681 RepID=UPI001074A802|nr:hypothetical protein [Flavobacterium foetidum]KAF2514234.1 hypothetical protein E0W73_12570 [Flavobacterium foetidum]